MSEELKQALYENLCAADNQDIPLEEYPDRILEVLVQHGVYPTAPVEAMDDNTPFIGKVNKC